MHDTVGNRPANLEMAPRHDRARGPSSRTDLSHARDDRCPHATALRHDVRGGAQPISVLTTIPSRRSWMHLVHVNIRMVTLGGERLSRGKTIALAIAALAVGGIFLALGVALLATLALVGTAVAAGVALVRLVRGRPSLPRRERSLDPSMEVFPADSEKARRLEGGADSP